MQRRTFVLSALAAAVATGTARAANGFPTHPVKVVMPYAAGGGPDVEMRRIADRFGEALGQTIVVDNRVGAGGMLGGRVVAQAPADGYTLLYGASSFIVKNLLQRDLKVDLLRDLAPIGMTTSAPAVVLVRGDSPYRTLDELLRAAKAQPGKMNYASGGIATAAHIAGATIVALAGLQVTHVPLRGSVDILASLQRGDTGFACPIAGTALPLIHAGVVRALAVTSAHRLKTLPNVPTLKEMVKSELAVQDSWFGLWAPHGTPAAVVADLHAALNKALADPAVVRPLEAAGSSVLPSDTPAAFTAFVQSEQSKWAEIVKLTKLSGS